MLNENTIIALHCIVDELFKGIGHRGVPCRKMRDSEVITEDTIESLIVKIAKVKRRKGYFSLRNYHIQAFYFLLL